MKTCSSHADARCMPASCTVHPPGYVGASAGCTAAPGGAHPCRPAAHPCSRTAQQCIRRAARCRRVASPLQSGRQHPCHVAGRRIRASERGRHVRGRAGTPGRVGLRMAWRIDGARPCSSHGGKTLTIPELAAKAARRARARSRTSRSTGPSRAPKRSAVSRRRARRSAGGSSGEGREGRRATLPDPRRPRAPHLTPEARHPAPEAPRPHAPRATASPICVRARGVSHRAPSRSARRGSTCSIRS